VSRRYLNLTAGAWWRLRRNWRLRPSAMLLWQMLVPGSLFLASTVLQKALNREQLGQANLKNAIVILGYWRSGTTLLHELLALDTRYTFPSTHACMNPHHFLLSDASVLAKRGVSGVQRPMDGMEVRPSSPQEDEFALLSLGARSPYEALLAPRRLAQSLKLADPRDLAPADEQRWLSAFLEFLGGVSVLGEGRPLVLKSPAHGFRVATLRELLPDARFILLVRDPLTQFESIIWMWRSLFETYSLGPIPSDDQIREDVLADRLRFEAKLAEGTAGLPGSRFVTVTYESLIADLVGVIEGLYTRLELGDFERVREIIAAQAERRREYRAQDRLPSGVWRERLANEWASVFRRYRYGTLPMRSDFR
jgi:hypothetical protein